MTTSIVVTKRLLETSLSSDVLEVAAYVRASGTLQCSKNSHLRFKFIFYLFVGELSKELLDAVVGIAEHDAHFATVRLSKYSSCKTNSQSAPTANCQTLS
jgi:hypothetical protein